LRNDVLQLLLGGVEMAADELVAVEPDPHARDLRRAVAVERHEVGEGAGLDRGACFLRQHRHPPDATKQSACMVVVAVVIPRMRRHNAPT